MAGFTSHGAEQYFKDLFSISFVGVENGQHAVLTSADPGDRSIDELQTDGDLVAYQSANEISFSDPKIEDNQFVLIEADEGIVFDEVVNQTTATHVAIYGGNTEHPMLWSNELQSTISVGSDPYTFDHTNGFKVAFSVDDPFPLPGIVPPPTMLYSVMDRDFVATEWEAGQDGTYEWDQDDPNFGDTLYAMTVDPNTGNIHVSGQFGLFTLDSDGNVIEQNSNYNSLFDLAVDNNGFVYGADSQSETVRCFDSNLTHQWDTDNEGEPIRYPSVFYLASQDEVVVIGEDQWFAGEFHLFYFEPGSNYNFKGNSNSFDNDIIRSGAKVGGCAMNQDGDVAFIDTWDEDWVFNGDGGIIQVVDYGGNIINTFDPDTSGWDDDGYMDVTYNPTAGDWYAVYQLQDDEDMIVENLNSGSDYSLGSDSQNLTLVDWASITADVNGNVYPVGYEDGDTNEYVIPQVNADLSEHRELDVQNQGFRISETLDIETDAGCPAAFPDEWS